MAILRSAYPWNRKGGSSDGEGAGSLVSTSSLPAVAAEKGATKRWGNKRRNNNGQADVAPPPAAGGARELSATELVAKLKATGLPEYADLPLPAEPEGRLALEADLADKPLRPFQARRNATRVYHVAFGAFQVAIKRRERVKEEIAEARTRLEQKNEEIKVCDAQVVEAEVEVFKKSSEMYEACVQAIRDQSDDTEGSGMETEGEKTPSEDASPPGRGTRRQREQEDEEEDQEEQERQKEDEAAIDVFKKSVKDKFGEASVEGVLPDKLEAMAASIAQEATQHVKECLGRRVRLRKNNGERRAEGNTAEVEAEAARHARLQNEAAAIAASTAEATELRNREAREAQISAMAAGVPLPGSQQYL